MSNEDYFLPKPSLTGAMFSNPLKSLVLLGAVYATGAFVGKQRSLELANKGAKKIKEIGSDVASGKMRQRLDGAFDRMAGSSNEQSVRDIQFRIEDFK